jgi:hypothetical protein
MSCAHYVLTESKSHCRSYKRIQSASVGAKPKPARTKVLRQEDFSIEKHRVKRNLVNYLVFDILANILESEL